MAAREIYWHLPGFCYFRLLNQVVINLMKDYPDAFREGYRIGSTVYGEHPVGHQIIQKLKPGNSLILRTDQKVTIGLHQGEQICRPALNLKVAKAHGHIRAIS